MPTANSIRLRDLRDNRFGDPNNRGQGKLLAEVANGPHDSLSKAYDVLQGFSDKKLNEFTSKHVALYSAWATGFAAYDDKAFSDLSVFSLVGETPEKAWINTHNCMGVVRLRAKATGQSVQLEIGSRFDDGDKQYFLTYMLIKIFGGSIAENVEIGNHSLWDMLLAFVFRHRLSGACKVGLFREYRIFQHNDLRFKGKLNLDEHLRRNVPFLGRLAYTTHEITFDNPINHLIRHAMEKVKRKWPGILAVGSGALSDGQELAAFRRDLEQNTPGWRRCGVLACIRENSRRPVKHPYFQPYYEPLRKIALSILRDEGAGLYETAEEAEGVLFDGSWLWENYIAQVLGPDFTHYVYRVKGRPVFKDEKDRKYREYQLYPDLYHPEHNVVIDCKYKRTETREDVHQLLAYLCLTGASHGGFVFPQEPKSGYPKVPMSHEVNVNLGPASQWKPGARVFWHDVRFGIPKHGEWKEFTNEMAQAEEDLRRYIRKLVPLSIFNGERDKPTIGILPAPTASGRRSVTCDWF